MKLRTVDSGVVGMTVFRLTDADLRPGVERGGSRGIDRQGVDMQVRQSRVGGGPGAAGVGGLKDPTAKRPGVERGGSRGIDRQGQDGHTRHSRINEGPSAAGVGGFEDTADPRPGVERGGGRGIDRQGFDVSAVGPAARPHARSGVSDAGERRGDGH